MKIYILADMEGISGIRMMEQVKQEHAGHYAAGCRLMTQEINLAVDAAFAAGADKVTVCDTHGGGGQLDLADVDPRATYETPNAGRMMPDLDKSYDGLVLLGHHAMAGTENGFLDHTMSSASWFEYRINDTVVGELAIEAAYAGHFDVPVIAVGGDAATAAEAKRFFGKDIPCAIVKWGIGRNRARCLPLPKAHAQVREAITQGVRKIRELPPFKPPMPGSIEICFYRSDQADAIARKPGNERIDGRRVRRQIADATEIRAVIA